MRLGLEVGKEFAGYRIQDVLGRGGMGIVYVAEHLRLGRKDALKVLAPQFADESFSERFVRESRLAARLDHPNIIPIYHAGEADGIAYIAMRLVQGADLGALLQTQGPLAPKDLAPIVDQVSAALDAAHEAGLVHRDVKPPNILISDRDERVFLTDFGIAKSQRTRGLTQTGAFLGTIDYCSPEQIEGKELDGRSDVYSLGAVIFEALTGRPPFVKDTDVAVIHAHLTEPPPAVTTVRPDLDPAIDGVVVTAMAKHPPVRYASAGDLAKAFREAIDVAAPVEGAPAPARPAAGTREGTLIRRIVSTMRAPRPLTPATVPSTRKRARRMWVAVALLLLTAAGGVAAAVVTIAGGEKHAATPITSTAARPPPPPSTSRTAPPKPPNLEPVPTADRFEWPKATLLAELPRLRGTVISGESCCAGERNSVAWVSLVTRSEPRSVWREVTQRWLPLLDGASYALAPGEVRTDELEGAAVESCLAPHVPCSLWRRARKRYRLDATGSQTSLVDGAQVMVRSIRNGVPWVEKALAHGKQLDTLRHPYDGTVKLWRPPYTEIEVAIGSPEDERLASDTSQREVDLVSLKRDSRGEVRPTYSPQDGRCFGPYVRDDGRPANLSLGPGQEYRDDFLECGDEAGRVPGPFSATGRLTFPRLNPLLPAGARVIGFTAEQAGIDRSSDESAHPGLTVSWSISFYGQPMNCQSGNTAYPLSPVKLTCSVRKRRGTVYEVDTRALVIRQVARNVTANGDLWAGLYRPTLELVVPRS